RAADLLDRFANCRNPVGVHHLIDRKLALPDVEGEVSLNRARAQFPNFGDLFNRLPLPEKRETLLAGSGIVFLLSVGLQRGYFFDDTTLQVMPRAVAGHHAQE